MALYATEHLLRLRDCLAQGRIDEAAETARALLADDPDAAEAHALLGRLAARGNDVVTALYHLDRAPGSGDIAAARGVVLARAGRYEEAIAPLTDAAEQSSDPLGALLRLAWVEERLGRFDELDIVLDRADALAKRAGKDIAVSKAVLRARTDQWHTSLATLDNAAVISGENRIARGRLRDRAGRYAEAWADFTTGKADIARAQNIAYPAASLDAHFEQLSRIFTAERFAGLRRATRRSRDAQPVFIAGAPRSGTTLVERLLTKGADVHARGELPFASALAQICAAMLGSYPGGFDALDAAVAEKLATALRDDYLAKLDAFAPIPKGAKFIDKMPFNEQFLPLLHLAFPEAPLVVMTRHPLDVILSMMSHDMTHGYGCASSAETVAHHLVAIDKLTAHWEAIGCPFQRLRYEDLVTGADSATSKIAQATGIMIRSGDQNIAPAVAATPSYAQVQLPLNDRSIGRWRAYAPQLRNVMPVLADYAARHDYVLEDNC